MIFFLQFLQEQKKHRGKFFILPPCSKIFIPIRAVGLNLDYRVPGSMELENSNI